MRNYENERAIDPEFLEEEVLAIPSLYGYYSDIKLDLTEQLREVEDQFELWRSGLVAEINNDPALFNLKKASIATVDATILQILHNEIDEINEVGIKAKSKIKKLQHDLDVIAIQLKSLDKKDSALDKAIKLFVANWFVGPKNPQTIKAGKRIVKEKSGKTAEKIRDAGKKRSRRNRG